MSCSSCSKFKYIDVVVHYCSGLEQLLWPHGAGLSENLNGLNKSLKSCISVYLYICITSHHHVELTILGFATGWSGKDILPRGN